MSTDNQTVNTADTDSANADSGNQTDANQTVAPPANSAANAVADVVRRETHQRVLQESKLFKERALKAEQELQSRTNAELAEQGKYKELSEQYKSKLEELETREVQTNLDHAVQAAAMKTGCVNVSALMKLGDANLLQYDRETGQVHGVDLFMENAQKEHPYLFGSKSTPNINHAMPGGEVKEKVYSATEIAKLRTEDPVKYKQIMDQLGQDAYARQRGRR